MAQTNTRIRNCLCRRCKGTMILPKATPVDKSTIGVYLPLPAGCHRPSPVNMELVQVTSGASAARDNQALQQIPDPVLSRPKCNYQILKTIARGHYGKVVECLKMETASLVVVKVLKQSIRNTKRECKMLGKISKLDPDKYNLVRFYESFTCEGQTCMVFEKLDKSLYQLLQERDVLSLAEIRPIIKQLLVAFNGLKNIGMIHTDLKGDNVMLVNHQQELFRIKLIDFGLAIPVSKVKPGQKFQRTAYRAPEVILGLPVTEAIDMWSLGHLMAHLLTGKRLYPACSEYDALKFITHTQGELSDNMLNNGLWTKRFFKQRTDCVRVPHRWEIKTPEEYFRATGEKHIDNREFVFEDLSELSDLYSLTEDRECEDLLQFLNLLKTLLHLDPSERMTPGEALNHPFITMCYMDIFHSKSNHFRKSFLAMHVCVRDQYPDYAVYKNFVDRYLSLEDADDDGEDIGKYSDYLSSRGFGNSGAGFSRNSVTAEAVRTLSVVPRSTVRPPPLSVLPAPANTPHIQETSSASAAKHNQALQDISAAVLTSPTCSYQVLQFMGEGAFGKVFKCLKMEMRTPVVVKVIEQHPYTTKDIKKECKMLQKISRLDPDKYNLVRFYESFTCEGQTCMVFEKLDKSLYQLLQERDVLSLAEIRLIIKQLLVAFNGLKNIGMIHTDLKGDNVMLVNHQQEPFRIKLIDFGLAIPVSKVKPGQKFQRTAYRAPEVILGLPVTEAIDMWSLGHLMAHLLTGKRLYPACSEYDALKFITHTQGELSNNMLNNGLWTKRFFKQRTDCVRVPHRWEIKTPEEYFRATGEKHIDNREFIFEDLFELSDLHSVTEDGECEDLFQFLGFLKTLLHLDPSERMTPREALNHPFITMCYMDGKIVS